MQPPTRCPRCGYPLRYSNRGYRCDFCGFPNVKPPLLDSVRRFERNVKAKVQAFMDKNRGPQYQRMIVQYPYAARQFACTSCGIRLPFRMQTCPYCGASQTTHPPAQPPSPTRFAIDASDQQVLDYIVAHNGTISMSEAAKELSIPPEELRSTIERLKSSGLLKPT